jgi:hypothetical protein
VNGSATVLSTTELSYNKTGGPVRPVDGGPVDRWVGGTGGPVGPVRPVDRWTGGPVTGETGGR